jgi:hypothetical protein
LANSKLDFSHPFFQKQIKKSKNDPNFTEALDAMKRLIEANHEACHRVVQDGMAKYPQCQGNIWKYDWQPEGVRSSGRKSWRLVAIVPDLTVQPYQIIAGGLYSKSTTDQLSAKQLAAIFAAVTTPYQEEPAEPDPQFIRVKCGEGDVMISVCSDCGGSTGKSATQSELDACDRDHDCPKRLV